MYGPLPTLVIVAFNKKHGGESFCPLPGQQTLRKIEFCLRITKVVRGQRDGYVHRWRRKRENI